MITNIDKTGIALTVNYECGGDPENPKWLKAYRDSGGVPTIGAGTIQYPNGQRVKMGDTITRQQMDEYFQWEIRDKVSKVNALTRDDVNQNHFNALTDFAYNLGTNALQKSTLLKIINKNLVDLSIVDRFMDWRFDNGHEVPGLIRRRMSEAYLFFTGKLKYDWINYHSFGQNTIDEVKSKIKI